ncbi:hypothetical protein LDENG_00264560 [Lucifuga dentata]|nr:hypothetical protein LDENG_00264560 [Lucifuga dentata]
MAHVKAKPDVIDEEMLQKAVMDQGPTDQAGRIAQEEGIQFCKVLKLSLSFRDLSFNSIEKIEGLESLRRLKMLNLFNNRISVIENMDTLEELTVFSLANNCLDQLDNVMYLRKFKNLRTLNLYGNPICAEEDNYMIFIAAYIPDLAYLDYKLLDEKTKNEAYEKYQYSIEEMRHNELQLQKTLEVKQSEEAELQLHKDSFVEFLNGSYLFESMLKDDPQKEILHRMPEVEELLQTYPFLLWLSNLCKMYCWQHKI